MAHANHDLSSDMRKIEAIGLHKRYVAIIISLAATCVFGRMSFVAGIMAFENPEPSLFQQFGAIWAFLYWAVLAMLIGMLLTHHVVATAAAVNLCGASALMAIEYQNIMPVGSIFPDPSTLRAVGIEIGTSLLVATVLAAIVQAVCRWFAKRLTRREY